MTEEKIGFKYIKDEDQERLAMRDETRLYNCGGLPVELTLPEGKHTEDFRLSLKITYNLGLDIWEYAHRG